MVVELVQTVFRDRVTEEEATCQAVFLMLKGGVNYHGIGLVEVLWKAVTAILNFHFAASITYHGSLHGFWSGRGTRTTSFEFNLLLKVTREELLYMIFLDLYKAYDVLERTRFLEILEGYGVGTRYL